MKLGYDLVKYRGFGIKLPVMIELGKTYSHILVAGKSGSGKSVSTIYYLYQLLSNDESHICIADYKGGEEYYDLLHGSVSYGAGESAVQIIKDFYQFFSAIRSNHIRLKKHYTLVIEEYSGLLTYLDTKDKALKKEIMAMIGEMLAVARGLNLGIMLVVQRADASYFTAGARDQFQCVLAFGRCSKEQFIMLGFSGEMDSNPTALYSAGMGLAMIDGKQPIEIIVPWIINGSEMAELLRKHLDSQPSLQELVQAIAKGDSAGL